MKRKIYTIVCIFLLTCTLVSCSPESPITMDPEDAMQETLAEFLASESESESEAVSEEKESTVTDTESSQTTAGITDEEVVALIDKMLLHEDYIEFGELKTGDEKIYVMQDGGLQDYYKIEDENFDTWEEWVVFVESIYGWGELIGIMNNPYSRMINVYGYTYVLCRSMEGGILDDYTYKIVESLPDKALVEIIRPEITPGKPRSERRWFLAMAETEMGWRITDIFPFT